MLKKNIFFLITLILSTFVLQIPAFATTATISISGDRGVVGLSASASFPIDPATGKTGGTVTIRRDGLSLYQASPTTSSWSYSRQYDTTGLADGSNATAYAYDKNGNLIQKSEAADITDYAYDYENRLSGINLPNGTNITYRYDAMGRRISKDINGQLTNYLYDTEDILSEQFPPETITHTHGPGIDNPISMSKASGQYYYHNDGLGSVVQLTNPSGSVIQSYQYDAYGNIIQKQGDLPNQFTYTGRELDPESGLYYYRNRYYDPTTGRFLTQDPIGMVDSLNLYTYVKNNPINLADPLGLLAEHIMKRIKEEQEIKALYEEFVITARNFPSFEGGKVLAHSLFGIPIYTIEGWKTPLWQKLYDINPHEWKHGGQQFRIVYDVTTGKIKTREELKVRIAQGEIEAYTESIRGMEKYLEKIKLR